MMSQMIELNAEVRTEVGKGASRRLRRLADKVPGILYGAERDAELLMLDANALSKAMQQETFFSQVLSIKLGGEAQRAVLRDLQRHPATDRVLHVDFLRISEDKELHINVPLHFLNEETCVGVKMGGGRITHNMIEVEIAALPANLPEFIEVDMQDVDINDVIHLSDLTLPEGVQLVALMYGDERDLNVVSVLPPRGGADEEEGEEVSAEEGDTADADAGDDAGDDASED